MRSKYKLLVSDIDGTLTNSKGIISAADLKAVRDIHRVGIKLSLCTGRPVQGCKAVLAQLPADDFHIFFDGALVCNSSLTSVPYSRPLEKELLKEICKLARMQALTLELFSKTELFIERPSEFAYAHSEMLNMACRQTDFDTLCQNEPVIMGCFVMPTAEEGKIKPLFSAFGDQFKLKFSWTMNPERPDICLVNVIMNDVSKGNALAALCAHLGVTPDETAAIGDGTNDVSLLSGAGLAIAMQNSPPELKTIADYVTLDVAHDGFAVAVQKFLFSG